MRKQWLFLLIAALASLTLWGCGSSGGSGGSDVAEDTEANVELLGVANCDKCHSDVVSDWATGHGNDSNFPDLSYFGNDPAECETCHNPSGEGETLPLALGEDARPVIGCEECHGGGSAHRGVGPLPHEWPDYKQCASCHDNAHGDYALATAVGNSAHNNSDDLHASATRCQRCHTTEGALLLSKYTGDADVMHLMDEDQDNIPPIAAEEDLHPVTCAACHDAHTGELRADSFIVNDNSLASGDWDPNGSGTADQFDFCTSCHTYYNQDGTLIGSGSDASGTAPFYHNTAWYRTLTTTHYDDPATGYGLGENIVEGYVIRESSDSPCFDCHGHEFRTNTRRADQEADPDDPDLGSNIHSQWAASGHGGRLLKQVRTAADAIDCEDIDGLGNPSDSLSRGRCEEVVDAAMMAGVDSTSGDPWIHYNWDDTDDRGVCQDCHTATGAMNYLDDPAAYDASENDFSHLESWAAVGGSPQNELLYCWGCHENAGTGTLNNPGAISRPYTVDSVDVTLPDVGSSNICINCHGARGNMEEYELAEDPTTDFTGLNAGFGPGTKNVTEAHYLVAAATIYAADTRIGYEYSDPDSTELLDYAPVPYFAHDMIAIDEIDDDGNVSSAGPCVACHMETDETHLFEVVSKDESGVITALNATSCVECHDGEHGAALVTEDGDLGTAAAAAAFLETEAEGYHEALEILRVGLGALGINFQSNYPYFDTSDAGSWINEGNFGAAHNYNYLHHEPGAYAHNRFYAKRLLFDSIDWVDNSTLDGSITIDAATYPEAAHWFGADANGVAERP